MIFQNAFFKHFEKYMSTKMKLARDVHIYIYDVGLNNLLDLPKLFSNYIWSSVIYFDTLVFSKHSRVLLFNTLRTK